MIDEYCLCVIVVFIMCLTSCGADSQFDFYASRFNVNVLQIVTLLFNFPVPITFESPWYDVRGKLGIKNQLSTYLSKGLWYDVRGQTGH